MFVVLKKTSLKLTFFAAVAALLLSVNLFGNVSAAGVFFNNSVKKMPVCSVAENETEIALGFDASFGADKTAAIVDSLVAAGARATFFLVGFWAEENEQLVKKIDEAGMEIGLHSNTHADFSKLNKAQMENEILRNKELLEKITGKKHNLMRFPFGKYNDAALDVCEKLGITAVQYNIDSFDLKGLRATEVIERVLTRAKGGSIVRLHNSSNNIATITPLLVKSLQQKGFRVTAVGDIVLTENYIIGRNGIQHKKN